MEREAVHFGSFGEQVYGFAQAVRAGDTIHVAGQTAMADDGTIEGDDMASQMAAAYRNVERALAPLGATLADVVEETLFVTDYLAAATVALDVRTSAYGGPPEVASTLVQVASLGLPDMLIEVKCTARI